MDYQKRNTLREFVFFNLIGVVNTLLGLVIYFSLIYLGVYYLVALVIDYIYGITFSFFMNKTYTFRIVERGGVNMFYKMICVYGLMFCLNVIFLSITVEIFRMNEYLGQIVSCGVLSIITFFLQKLIVFRNIDI